MFGLKLKTETGSRYKYVDPANIKTIYDNGKGCYVELINDLSHIRYEIVDTATEVNNQLEKYIYEQNYRSRN